jgi:hypothetical protein
MMGIERGNIDLFILALVGAAAITIAGPAPNRMPWAVALVELAIVLKLYPLFCVALAARFNRRTLLFAVALAALSVVYFAIIFDYILIIRQNTPTTFKLSYGYKVIFLGLDHMRAEAGVSPIELANTVLPVSLVVVALIFAVVAALRTFRHGSLVCLIADGVPGVAFLFGAGIYCGSFLLGTNFIYRLMFLLLCLPQLQDWSSAGDRTGTIARVFQVAILLVLWSSGNSNGHTTFMIVPQLMDWLLFFGLTTILLVNFLNSGIAGAKVIGANGSAV